MNLLRNVSIAIVIFTLMNNDSQADTVENIRLQIVDEFHLLTIAGQNQLMDQYAEALLIENPTGMTTNVTFDHETSVLTSYTFASEDFVLKYRKQAVFHKIKEDIDSLCEQPHVEALRKAGITQRLLLLNRDDDSVFVGLETPANPQAGLEKTTREIQEALARIEFAKTGKKVTFPKFKLEGCVKPLGWREKNLERDINSDDNTEQQICEDKKKLELLKKYKVEVYSYRETELVERVKEIYYDHIFSICEPKPWEFWKKNHYDD